MVKLDIPLRVRASSSSSQTRVGFFPVPVRQSVAPRARLDRFDRLMTAPMDSVRLLARSLSRAVSSSSVSSHDSHDSRFTSRRFTHTHTHTHTHAPRVDSGGFGFYSWSVRVDFPPCDGACPRLVSFFLDRVKISIVSVSVSVSVSVQRGRR